MNVPEMRAPAAVAPGTALLPAWIPVPSNGVLAVNSFVIRGEEPVLVDTGLAALRKQFLDALESVVDPEAIRWIWLTHMDPDHVGNLAEVLALAPRARLVTNFLGMGKLGMLGLPADRVRLLDPGQALELPDRRLHALRPPSYDAPETMACFDESSASLFSSDSFGALLPDAAETAAAVSPDTLRDGLVNWTTVDCPWLPIVDAGAFRLSLRRIRELRPERILGSHLPPAPDMTDTLLEYLDAARSAPPFPGPHQAALEAMTAA